MKKLLSLFLALILILLCGCAASIDKKTVDGTTDTITSSDKDSQTINETDNKSSEQDTVGAPSSSLQSIKDDSKAVATETQTSQSSVHAQNQTTHETSDKAQIPSLNTSTEGTNTSGEKNNPTNNETSPTPSSSSTDELVSSLGKSEDDAAYYLYELNGTVTDWFVENNLIHIIFKNVNRYAVFDTNSGSIIKDKPLNGRPAEIHNFGNELWISYPELKCIKIHDKETFSVKSSVYFEHSVSSFDVYEDYIIYTEDDQHVKAYRYNMSTSETVNIRRNNGGSFYQADVLVNKEHQLVYIGESGSTGSELYCFDIESLEFQFVYSKDNYGYMNIKRRSFLSDGFVYWGEFKLNALNVSRVEGQYTGTYPTGMLQVDDNFVITTNGIYLKDTCEQIVVSDAGYSFSMLAITETGNIVVIEQNQLCIASLNS